ncbi:hypothetical protein HMPREF3227_01267 [Corynebacterium sp. CMW7794]|nr:hypothetical protein HMPREF3227_01267 [Corynebacterium sp. CMW7794]
MPETVGKRYCAGSGHRGLRCTDDQRASSRSRAVMVALGKEA